LKLTTEDIDRIDRQTRYLLRRHKLYMKKAFLAQQAGDFDLADKHMNTAWGCTDRIMDIQTPIMEADFCVMQVEVNEN
jgi:hypothetical protein